MAQGSSSAENRMGCSRGQTERSPRPQSRGRRPRPGTSERIGAYSWESPSWFLVPSRPVFPDADQEVVCKSCACSIFSSRWILEQGEMAPARGSPLRELVPGVPDVVKLFAYV